MFDQRMAFHRLEQQIAWRGEFYTVTRKELNEFNEKTSPVEIGTIKGIFHNGSSNHVKVNISDNGQVIEKNTPYIMTTWFNGSILKKDDIISINSVDYKVTGIANIGEYNIIAEVSLEVILNGN